MVERVRVMIVEIGSSGCAISVRNGLIEVQPPGGGAEPFRIPAADISRVVFETGRATISSAALVLLARSGVPVLFCDGRHEPAAELVVPPGVGHPHDLFRAQILLRKDTRGRLWKRLVAAKIAAQADVLASHAGGQASARLRRLAGQVGAGDTANREATAAQIYWPVLMGRDFQRGAPDCPVNALLNYGYAVVRSVILRALHDAGLHPGFGIHHHGRDNPGNLADDLIEPYRPAVDRLARHLMDSQDIDHLTPDLKARLAELPRYPVRLGDQWMRLGPAVLETVRSHAAVLRRQRSSHVLPESLGEAEQCPTPGAPCG